MRLLLERNVFIALLLVTAACGPTVDLSTNLEVLDAPPAGTTRGIVDGKNKLVPSVTFKVRNKSDQSLVVLQVNAIFRRVTDKDEWGSGFVTVAGSEGLDPGAISKEITLRSELGYTGTETRAEMLQNSQFVDAKVELFAKYARRSGRGLASIPSHAA